MNDRRLAMVRGQIEAFDAGVKHERERVIAYARKLNYGPTLRTFIKHVAREYHDMAMEEAGRQEQERKD